MKKFDKRIVIYPLVIIFFILCFWVTYLLIKNQISLGDSYLFFIVSLIGFLLVPGILSLMLPIIIKVITYKKSLVNGHKIIWKGLESELKDETSLWIKIPIIIFILIQFILPLIFGFAVFVFSMIPIILLISIFQSNISPNFFVYGSYAILIIIISIRISSIQRLAFIKTGDKNIQRLIRNSNENFIFFLFSLFSIGFFIFLYFVISGSELSEIIKLGEIEIYRTLTLAFIWISFEIIIWIVEKIPKKK